MKFRIILSVLICLGFISCDDREKRNDEIQFQLNKEFHSQKLSKVDDLFRYILNDAYSSGELTHVKRNLKIVHSLKMRIENNHYLDNFLESNLKEYINFLDSIERENHYNYTNQNINLNYGNSKLKYAMLLTELAPREINLIARLCTRYSCYFNFDFDDSFKRTIISENVIVANGQEKKETISIQNLLKTKLMRLYCLM
ncbi:hypothetical protein [Aureibacter tunicatorum]|uniref:Lipoprotein n=1 Tax=Aureibacter tunicatorum TaxID=866807 RepID=A0AAE3XKY2_9BACT|nr:hypothetical protein [Aureibacter tunicatorum]MDR6237899.1 hypothetical protein [Aureibacter tunicatorum]BDD02932.1 hypothetical protein AUTU_04150 [Aureibacter tunicatorum]